MALFTACLKPDPVVVEPKIPKETAEAEAQADIETPMSVAREQGADPIDRMPADVFTPRTNHSQITTQITHRVYQGHP